MSPSCLQGLHMFQIYFLHCKIREWQDPYLLTCLQVQVQVCQNDNYHRLKNFTTVQIILVGWGGVGVLWLLES